MASRDLQVHVSCFDPDSNKQRIRVREGNPSVYRVFLFLAGRDLPYVDSATYVLHPTFKNPRRTVRRTPSNPHCKLETWAWGEFPMETEVRLKTGDFEVFHHIFEFSRDIEKAKREFPSAFQYE
ncbi:MAG: pYEATS domain-containing protein [Candidatus Binatia bacterium]